MDRIPEGIKKISIVKYANEHEGYKVIDKIEYNDGGIGYEIYYENPLYDSELKLANTLEEAEEIFKKEHKELIRI